ncbi:UNVERIFIED_CONTAM: hypothetical protein DQE83_25180 [Escherichia coli]
MQTSGQCCLHVPVTEQFLCVDVQNCTISDTKTAVVPSSWRFLKVICLKNSLDVVCFPNSKRPPTCADAHYLPCYV